MRRARAWTRPAEFLVYVVPVGDAMPASVLASYTRLLQAHCVLSLRSLTRPGGYAAELSPFDGFSWTGSGSLRFRFVSIAAERVEMCNGEDVHASHRVIGVLGICHCPSLVHGTGLQVAYTQFQASVRLFPALLVHKLFAFEHSFEDVGAVREYERLDDLVMFPMHHELQGTGESTVSLHFQVVMNTLAVHILMSLESTIRSVTSSLAVANGLTSAADLELADLAGRENLASVLLDVNVEPQQTHDMQCSPLVLSRDGRNGGDSFDVVSSSDTRLTGSLFSSSSVPSPLSAAKVTVEPTHCNRRRKRQVARREKLVGDYNVLVSCISSAMRHYVAAIEMLREEERRSGGAPGDALWLAAALEGYVYCLYTESQNKFSAELVEKASEAVAFYANAGTTELESLLIENMGWYYAGVAMSTCASMAGDARMLESVWVKRLLWDVLERGMILFPDLQSQRQVEFLIQASRMLEMVGHHRRVALFLHEAASLLLARNASVQPLSPTCSAKGQQWNRDLKAALILEQMAAEQLGIQGLSIRKGEFLPWEVTSQYRKKGRETTFATDGSTDSPDNSWLVIRFHVLRQLLTIARMLGDALLVGTYCLQILEMLVWCDSVARQPKVGHQSSPASREASGVDAKLVVDDAQQPAASLRNRRQHVERVPANLHSKSGLLASPPPGIDCRIKRNVSRSPSVTISNAAASLSSTLSNTPRLLATPRQHFSAAVNALSTRASPSFMPFSHAYHHHIEAMSDCPDGVEDCTSTATTSDPMEVKSVSEDGEDRSGSSLLPYAADGKLDDTCALDAMNVPISPWDLRSKSHIVKIQRRLLNVLESDCGVLQTSAQVQLPTFLRVDRLELCASCNVQDPFLSRATALRMFGVQSTSSQQAVKRDFFYSPFEKRKTRETGQRKCSDEQDASGAMPDVFEKGFSVYERIEVQLTLSNPTGIPVKLQEVKAWVTFVEENDESAEKNSSTKVASNDGGVECYACSFTLEPYEKHKAVMLEIQPFRAGTFHVRGCFMKAHNITTSFELETPVRVRVVDELPMVSLSLREQSTMTLANGEMKAKSREPATSTMRPAMFSSETRQFVLCIRSTGNRQITNCRLAVTVQHRHAATTTHVLFNNLPTEQGSVQHVPGGITNGTIADGLDDGEMKTEVISLRCGKVASSPLPLVGGDSVTVPFQVSLRHRHTYDEQVDDGIRIEWSFVYGNETQHTGAYDGENTAEDVFYRESKLAFEIVRLPSMMLHSVTTRSCCVEQLQTSCRSCGDSADAGAVVRCLPKMATSDHLYCMIIVHVVNPTETTFRLRLRRAVDGSDDITCEAEIGRQCSRQLVIEVPRLQSLPFGQGSSNLTEVLNELMEIEWETCCGIRGRLLCEDHHMGQATEHGQLELFLPPIRFQIQPPDEGFALASAGSQLQKGEGDVPEGIDDIHRLRFFQVSHLRHQVRTLHAELFKYIPIAVSLQRTGDIGNKEHATLCVEVEVVITDEGDEAGCEMSDHVMVVGQLKSLVRWDSRIDRRPRLREIQCMFLSDGNFRVAVCGRVIGLGEKYVGGEIWCHQPLYVCARSQEAIIAERTAQVFELATRVS
uniref:Trafficking protein particle complex subunit 11 domain-containing protein n=1 Tax=Peronospora matthiolae TaxID=2874970 RepID=A0AAV1TUL4_9STRA